MSKLGLSKWLASSNPAFHWQQQTTNFFFKHKVPNNLTNWKKQTKLLRITTKETNRRKIKSHSVKWWNLSEYCYIALCQKTRLQPLQTWLQRKISIIYVEWHELILSMKSIKCLFSCWQSKNKSCNQMCNFSSKILMNQALLAL
jgi:hypothetical protein